MTRSIVNIVRPALIALLVVFLPAGASAQDQTQAATAAAEEETAVPVDEAPSETEASRQQTGLINVDPAGPSAETAKQDPSSEADTVHIVKKKDTLWDITNAYLKDPFLWPFVWKANPYISNADLIYPGNRVIIPGLGPVERALGSGDELADRGGDEGTGQASAVPTSKPGLEIPKESPSAIANIYEIINAGYVAEAENRDLIVGGEDGKGMYAFDDLVYVRIRSREKADIGDRFIVYKALHNVKHPLNGRKYGKLVKACSLLKITGREKDDLYRARITYTFDVTERGEVMLVPYVQPDLTYGPNKKSKDIVGHILEVTDKRTINGQIDVVFLDKGKADDVEAGDRFIVYTKAAEKKASDRIVGEAQVVLVKDKTATAFIRKSTDVIVKGDSVQFKKQ